MYLASRQRAVFGKGNSKNHKKQSSVSYCETEFLYNSRFSTWPGFSKISAAASTNLIASETSGGL
jgi:hypothetical protein